MSSSDHGLEELEPEDRLSEFALLLPEEVSAVGFLASSRARKRTKSAARADATEAGTPPSAPAAVDVLAAAAAAAAPASAVTTEPALSGAHDLARRRPRPLSGADASGFDAYEDALESAEVYDSLPESSKVVILNTKLIVRDAFAVLVEHNVTAAPLWDSDRGRYAGLITVTDFIAILRQFYRSPFAGMHELVELTIEQWRAMAPRPKRAMVACAPSDTMWAAANTLIANQFRRLPVIDPATNAILGIVTHLSIVTFAFDTVAIRPPFLARPIAELGVGVFAAIITVTAETPLIVVLNVFFERQISSIPVIDAAGVLLDVYSKQDVFDLARSEAYDNLDISVLEAIRLRRAVDSPVCTCARSDPLEDVVERIRSTRAHRLVVVDAKYHVVGIVTRSDVVRFLCRFE